MTPTSLQPLFVAIREACSPRSWSIGIELARGDAVDGIAAGAESVELRVKVPGKTVSPTVTLYPEDDEWGCDCDGSANACEHVAAAIIALRQARKEGRELPSSARTGGAIVYRLRREDRGLAIERWVVSGAGEERLGESLAGVLSGRLAGPGVEPSKVDLSLDQLLAMHRVRSLPYERLLPFWPLLSRAERVELEGAAVQVSEERLLPPARVVDGPRRGTFVLRYERPSLDELVVPGVARVGQSLRLVGDVELGGADLACLPIERTFDEAQVAELVMTILPRLRSSREVVVETRRLPRASRDPKPRAVVSLEQRGGALSLLGLVEYGDPPCARLAGDELVHLGGSVPTRDLRAEQRARQRLAELDLVPGKRIDLVGGDAIAMAARLRELGDAVRGAELLDRYSDTPLAPRVHGRGVRFGGAGGEADAEAVIGAWQRGATFVPLIGGGWGALPTDWLERHGHLVRQLYDARQADGSLAAHARPALARLCRELDHPTPADLEGLATLVDGFEAIPQARLPDDLTAELRPYQRRGVDWLCFLRDAGIGAVLADDMGLGKTVQTLCAVRGRTLVVCPRSVLHNWLDEMKRFRPGLSHALYHGPRRRLEGVDVTVTTYALLRSDVAELGSVEWDTLVLDEAQAIKNPESQAAEAAYKLRAGFRVAVGGTPVENRLEELWSLMHFTNRGLLGGRSAFEASYARPIAAGSAQVAARLRRHIAPFLLRREKRAVAPELPPRAEAVMRCALDDQERELYDALLLASREEVLEKLDAGGNVMAALEALLRLRQAACDIALVPGHPRRREPSSKIRRLMLALEQAAADGHKALVFSQWTSLLDRVEPHLERAGIAWARLDGSTVDRAGVVARFQADDGPPVMLLSLKAGGTGLNLTAADHVFLLDPWWNPAAEDQAADRAHRIGQERPVMIYRMVAADTVDERILELQKHKRAIADAVLGEADKAASLTRDDLLALLR